MAISAQRSTAMGFPTVGADQQGAERRAAAERARRDSMWAYIATALACVGWAGAGIFLLMWSAHTTSATYGRIAFYGGLVVGNGGVLFTLIAAYLRGEQRGDR
jgi:hypothetical protein